MLLVQRNHSGNVSHEVYQDTQTGVQYLIIITGNGLGYNNAAITPLLNRDGNPLVSGTIHEGDRP